MIKAVIFDCFGVLISGVIQNLAYQLRVEGRDADAIEVHSLLDATDIGIISTDQQIGLLSDLLATSRDDLLQKLAVGEIPNQDIIKYIETLKPRYKTALMSNISNRQRISMRLPAGTLERLFDVIVLSGDIGYIKPEPEIYKTTLEQLGVTAGEAVFTDDIEINCQAAEELGIRSIQFSTFPQFKREFEAIEAEVNGN